MKAYSFRMAAVAAAITLVALLLASCSGSTVAKAGSPDFYWSAARSAYAAGDYLATVEQLDHLIDHPNEFTSRAIPWSLVLTTGLAAGYVELAGDYAKGALMNKAIAPACYSKAAEYRNLASPLLLSAVRTAGKLDQLPPGSVLLAFGRPRGQLAPPTELLRIAAGLPISAEDAEQAPAMAIERNVLLSACSAVGAPDDSAKASEILGHASTITPRATFANAMAKMLETAGSLYTRNVLDYPDKLAMVEASVKALRAAADQPGPAMVVKVQSGVH